MKDRIYTADKEHSNSVQKNFEIAVNLVKSLPQKGPFQPSYSEAGKIYSLFKQSKFGACTQPRPGFWDLINRAKWDAWAALGDMPQETAMRQYLEEIKKIYSRIREIDEFAEQEENYVDTLIPFCEVTGLQLPVKLLKIANERKRQQESENNVPVVVDETSQANGMDKDIRHTVKDVLNGNDDAVITVNCTDLETSENGEHSVLLEMASNLTSTQVNNHNGQQPTKSVSFNDDINNGRNENDHDQGSGSEEEVYCDSIDPDQLTSASGINQDGSLISKTGYVPVTMVTPGQTYNKQNTSTPYLENVKTNGHEHTSQSKYKGTKKRDNGKQNTSSDSSTKDFDLLHELDRPYPCRNASPTRHTRRATVRSHKRKGGHSTTNTSQTSERVTRSRNAPSLEDSTTHPSSDYYRRHRQSSQSNNSGSDDDSCNSMSSITSDSIGLKIVQALERMEENLHEVLDRLDSIEKNMKAVTQTSVPWWKQYAPSKTIMIFTVWPIIVNLLFYLFWKRKLKQRVRKC